MSWSTEFYAAIKANAAFDAAMTSIFYQYNADAVAPFAKYDLIAGNDTISLAGSSPEGVYLVQLSVWASSPTDAENHALNAIVGAKANLNVTQVFKRTLGRDDEEELFGYAVDFTIWYDTP